MTNRIRTYLVKHKWLHMMILPGLMYFLIFKYLPMYGVFIAFQDYQPFLGVWKSDWVGLKHFHRFFTEPVFWLLLRNTFMIAVCNILFFFPLPIILSLMLNEVRNEIPKRIIQSLIYVPHFMSWVVVVGIVSLFLAVDHGMINDLIRSFGGEPIQFLVKPEYFRSLITLEVIWKDTGWGTIIFLAALASVDPQLYEAARMDGANRLRQMWHITLPAIRSTIVVLLILRLGHFLDTGFEQIYLMLNAMTRDVGEVFDTYVYTTGVQQGLFSYTTAVGLFKSVVSLVLVVGANHLARRMGEEGIY
jgi:putative aldouronate transport system permease protein